MNILKKKNTAPIIKVIVIFMLSSFLLGIILSINIDVNQNYQLNESNFFEKVITLFSFNYWFIFLVWQLGKTKGIFLITYLLVFFKCMLMGLVFLVNLKGDNVFNFLKYFLLDLVLYFPLLGIILYDVSLYNFYDDKRYNSIAQIIFYSFWVLIYSLLCSVIGSKI